LGLDDSGIARLMRGLAGRTVAIAGGGRGIGAATARRLAAEGAAVVVGDIKAEWAVETAAAIRANGGKAIGLGVDGTSPESVAAFVAATLAEFGRLDGFHVNLAGGTVGDIDALNCPLDVFDRGIAINLKSHLICTQAALPVMLERGGGAMIYTSSGAASGASAWQVAYPMAKNGIHALVRHVAQRWGKQGIRANGVAPGLVLTEAVREHMTDEQVSGAEKRIPSIRLGHPDDIAGVVALLASDDGIWINGQVIHVNGGAQMRD
jgi:NAD(P)-dependent dehydrogenase (short-subunit alcohol dehydrogenase family)